MHNELIFLARKVFESTKRSPFAHTLAWLWLKTNEVEKKLEKNKLVKNVVRKTLQPVEKYSKILRNERSQLGPSLPLYQQKNRKVVRKSVYTGIKVTRITTFFRSPTNTSHRKLISERYAVQKKTKIKKFVV